MRAKTWFYAWMHAKPFFTHAHKPCTQIPFISVHWPRKEGSWGSNVNRMFCIGPFERLWFSRVWEYISRCVGAWWNKGMMLAEDIFVVGIWSVTVEEKFLASDSRSTWKPSSNICFSNYRLSSKVDDCDKCCFCMCLFGIVRFATTQSN